MWRDGNSSLFVLDFLIIFFLDYDLKDITFCNFTFHADRIARSFIMFVAAHVVLLDILKNWLIEWLINILCDWVSDLWQHLKVLNWTEDSESESESRGTGSVMK